MPNITNLPPAFPDGYPEVPEHRPATAFESYLKQKQAGAAVSPQQFAPFQGGSPAAVQDESQQRPASQSVRRSPSQQQRALTPLQQAAAGWLQANAPRAGAPFPSPKPGPGALATGSASLSVAPLTASRSPEPSSLIEAAATLAHAARSLATAPTAISPTNPNAAAISSGYKRLARAAEELANTVGLGEVTPLPPLETGPLGPAAGIGPFPGAGPIPAGQHPGGGLSPGGGSSTAVWSSGSSGVGGVGVGGLPPRPQSSLIPFAKDAERAAVGAAPGRVSTPKFKPVNPMVAFISSELPRPGTAAAAGAVTAGAGAPGCRPLTANPITHTLHEPPRPQTSVPGSAAAVASGPTTRFGVGGGVGSRPGSVPGPGDCGSEVAQVLEIAETNGPQGGTGPAGGTEKRQVGKDTMDFVLKHPDRVRLTSWPPSSPYTESEIAEDDRALKYNAVLGLLRARIASHGLTRVVKGFKEADRDGSGALEAGEFKEVVRRMDLGSGVDEEVLDMMLGVMDGDHDGRVNYTEFVGAVRFNRLPYAPLNPKFKHRTRGNPEQPFGNPSVQLPFGTMGDVARNDAASTARMDAIFQELHAAFSGMDTDGDGIIDAAEFRNAMKMLDARHRLNLSDEYIGKVFREADWDYSRGIDYNEFLGSFAGAAGTRFVPEFLKPRSLRCSALGHPWEWRGTAKRVPPPGAINTARRSLAGPSPGANGAHNGAGAGAGGFTSGTGNGVGGDVGRAYNGFHGMGGSGNNGGARAGAGGQDAPLLVSAERRGGAGAAAAVMAHAQSMSASLPSGRLTATGQRLLRTLQG